MNDVAGDDKYMGENYILIGIFLFIIGFSMVIMTLTYLKTNKLNLSWMFFGFFYTVGLLILFTNNPLKNYLQIAPADKFYSLSSLIILLIGIMLSYVICGKKGDRYIIAGILFSVGIHFIPFNTPCTYILSGALIANALFAWIKKDFSIFKILSIDAFIKIALGIYLIVAH